MTQEWGYNGNLMDWFRFAEFYHGCYLQELGVLGPG